MAAVAAMHFACAPATRACSALSYPAEKVRQFRIEQDARERDFIRRTAAEADLIIIAEVVDTNELAYDDTGEATVTFRTERVLKGVTPTTFTATWHNVIARRNAAARARDERDSVLTFPGCWPEDNFDAVWFDRIKGYRYLIYLREGVVLRASQFTEGPALITADDEARMIPPQTR